MFGKSEKNFIEKEAYLANPESKESWLASYIVSLKMLTRNAKLYLLGAFLIGITDANFHLLYNLYLRERGLGEFLIGNIRSSVALGATLIALPAAIILSRRKLQPILVVSSAVFIIASAVMAGMDDIGYLMPVALVSGMAVTFYRVASAPFYMRNSTPKERPLLFSLGFGMFVLSGALGSLGAGYLVGFLFQQTGDMVLAHRYALYGGIILGAFGMIPFAMIRSKAPDKKAALDLLSFARLRKRGFVYFKLVAPYFTLGLGAGLIIPFLNIYFRDKFGQTPDQIGWYFFLLQTSTFIGILAGPAMVRMIGKIKTIVTTELASIPFMLVLAFTGNISLAVAAFLLRGALMNLSHPVGANFAMELIDHKEQELVNALMKLSWTGSWVISASVGGAIIESQGYELPMLITAGLYVFSSLLYFAFFNRSESRVNGSFVVREVEESS